MLSGAAFLVFSGAAAQCQGDAGPTPGALAASRAAKNVDSTAAAGAAARPLVTFKAPDASAEDQRKLMLRSARTAWDYVERNYSPASGLVKSLDTYAPVTIWDIASALAAYYSAHGLGIISDADYRRRMDRALQTLEGVALYDAAAFNKLYDSRTGVMLTRDAAKTSTGYGWSALDMGRFLTWMRILADNDPGSRAAVERIVHRLDLNRLVKDGYLRGGTIDPEDGEHKEYQEGRIGYEQYAASGLALWNVKADRALTFEGNGTPVDVLGFPILSDRRGGANLTSEPFLMMGLEIGWPTREWEEQARNVLAAQRERFRRTKIITMVSEDAVPVKPAYFYYYVLQRDGKDFVVRAASGGVSESYPRWVSTKAAFGWHALFPSAYTWSAVQVVQPAGASGRGWSAGVYERSHRATPSFNLNTAAIVLEAAYFAQRQCPLVKPSCG